ncbi:MAG: MATE family efflux transporter [Chitinophagaceae bacterium]
MANYIDKGLQVSISNRDILKIALPITAALLIPNINFITNNIFLGGLGERELGNAGTVGVYYLIMMVIGNGLNNSLQSLISRQAGTGDLRSINVIFAQGIRISLLFAVMGMLITWFIAPLCLKPFISPGNFELEMEFLRIRVLGLPFLYLFQMGNAFLVGTLNSKSLMIGFVGEALLNIFFDYVLIYGEWGFPNLGFNGAAWASVIAEFGGMCIVYSVIYFKGFKEKFNLFNNFSHHGATAKSILNRSAPLVMQYVISLTTWLVFFILLEQYGDRAKAISNAMRNVFGIVGVFIWAFASTSNTVVSNLIGQGLQDRVISAINRITLLSFTATFCMAALLNIFPETFLHLFQQDQQFVEEAKPIIRIISLGMLIMSIAAVWLNAVTGTGKTRMNLLIELAAVIMYILYIYIVMVYLRLSLAWAWTNEFIYWLAIFGLAFWYMKSGKWKEKNING